MSQRADGTYKCDRCDGDVGNASITLCVIVADMTEDGEMVTSHFCRAEGCAKLLLRNRFAARKEAGLAVGLAGNKLPEPPPIPEETT